jgi:hypothetical protein
VTRNLRTALIVGAVALVVIAVYAGLVYLAQGYFVTTAPGGSVFSGAPDGTRVLYDYLGKIGARPHILQQFEKLPPTDSTIVAVSPFPRAFSTTEGRALSAWVRAGGRLALVGTQVEGIPGLEAGPADLALATLPGTSHVEAPILPAPFADGVRGIRVGTKRLLADGPNWVTHFKDLRGQIVISRAVGQGEIVWLSDPLPISNEGIGQADDARFATILAARRPDVYFDEYHHGYVSGGGIWDRLGDGGRVASLLVAAAILVGLLASARRLGPPVTEVGPAAERTTAWVGPLAELYRKAEARNEALASLAEGLRRSLTRRYGTLAAGLAARQEAAAALAAAQEVVDDAATPSRDRFIDIARRLVRARQEVEKA